MLVISRSTERVRLFTLQRLSLLDPSRCRASFHRSKMRDCHTWQVPYPQVEVMIIQPAASR
jgi:hypothetical protein